MADLADALDERRFWRLGAQVLPVVTIGAAVVVGFVVGPSMSLLVIAAGLLLAVIALLWTSLRLLSGDVELPPELAALDMAARGVDALAVRKKMLLRALKDLDNEHALGKLEDDDYAPIKETYRDELKKVLRSIDESLAPHRERAEELARAHLAEHGLAVTGEKAEPPRASPSEPEPAAPQRRECPECNASNEADAKFCKGCAARLEAADA